MSSCWPWRHQIIFFLNWNFKVVQNIGIWPFKLKDLERQINLHQFWGQMLTLWLVRSREGQPKSKIVASVTKPCMQRLLRSHGNTVTNFVTSDSDLGYFHTIGTLLVIIGKHFQDAGLRDLCIECGIISEGSIAGVLEGRYYNRVVWTHKLLYEPFVRLACNCFLSGVELFCCVNSHTFKIWIIPNIVKSDSNYNLAISITTVRNSN